MKDFADVEARVKNYHAEKLLEHGDSPKGVDWKDTQSQQLRFAVLAGLFNTMEDFSVLDVGCGFGDLFSYLQQQGFRNVRYTGIDLLPEMVELARKKHAGNPDASFEVSTIDQLEQQFDYVVSSGIMNIRGDQENEKWLEYIKEMIAAHYAAARIGAAVNCITSYVDFTADHLYYCDPGVILDYCKRNLSRFATIRHDYDLYEFTAYIYRHARQPDGMVPQSPA